MKQGQRVFLLALFLAGVGSLVVAFIVANTHWQLPHLTTARMLSSSGLFFDIAGIIQLEVSGTFEKILEKFGNETVYPYGPPSPITRQIIDNPDTPIRTGLRNWMFFHHQTGIWLIVTGFVLQLCGVWL
jgi:hypothetical protein